MVMNVAVAMLRSAVPERVAAELVVVQSLKQGVNLWRRISDGLGEELADSLDAEQEQSAPVRH